MSQELLKWLASLVISALTAFGVTCKKQIAEFFKFKRKKRNDELLSDVNEEMTSIEDQIEQHEEDNALEFKRHDQLYAKKLAEVEERLMRMLAPMQAALLSSHYQSLFRYRSYHRGEDERLCFQRRPGRP